MAKYYGIIGFAITQETVPGVWKETKVEKNYYGEMSDYKKSYSSGEGVNDDISFTNTISLLVDPFIMDNFYAIRYVTLLGAKWKVKDATIKYPRIELSLGGLYNG